MTLRAPFPWFGGKSRAASLIWLAFGDVPNFVEPFAGSLAVLLRRPHPPRVETVNDRDCYLANFWRAVQDRPGLVARWADWPVNEADLHARHRWLVKQKKFRERMRKDPAYYNAKIAGWWVWGLSQWIGTGWCAQPTWEEQAAEGVQKTCGIHTSEYSKKPALNKPGRGVHQERVRQLQDLRSNPEYSRRPNLCPPMGVQGRRARGTTTSEHEQRPELSGHRGVHAPRLREQLPMLSGDSGATGRGVHGSRLRKMPHPAGSGSARTEGLYRWMDDLQGRLRHVRVCCGDFERVLGPSVTEKIGLTAVLLDPPYDPDAGRDPSVYAEEDRSASRRAREWALANGENPKLRIALCGLEGEHEMPSSWQCVPWKASGGYAAAAGNHENAHRERIWFSPACLRVEPAQRELFAVEAAAWLRRSPRSSPSTSAAIAATLREGHHG